MHRPTNYKDTRLLLGEAHFFVVFSTVPFSKKKYLMSITCGLTDKETRALRYFGRWVMVRKDVPQVIVGASSACDLSYLTEISKGEE